MNLAKSPASTIQILGAEKALFRALKTKHDTPKYGLIYHASLVGQATGKNKGKIARMLAAKAAIGLRVDALSDWSAQGEGKGDDVDEEERSALGVLSRAKIERHLRGLEGKPLLPRGVAVGPDGKALDKPGKWELKEAKKYNADADGIASDAPAAVEEKKEKSSKKDKKLIQEVESESESEESDEDVEMEDAKSATNGTPKKSKKEDKKSKKEKTPKKGETDEEKYGALAEAAGISVAKYKRKAERGEIKLNADGTPLVVSKKDLKKQRKAEEKAAAADGSKEKKRKRDASEDAEEVKADKSEKKEKKKSKKSKA
jgi:nucleolar protein 58